MQQSAAAISKLCGRCPPKILSGSFRARTGRWPARAVGTRDWDLFQTQSETVETSFLEAREFVAQGDRVLVVGFARGRIKATNRTFEDHWVFAITVRNGKLTNIRECIDTQALARASEMAASPRALPIETDTTRNDS